MSIQLTAVDYLVIISYLCGTMVIGLWVGSYIRSGSDFFLAGRSLPWWAVGMSLVATDIGGTDLIGVGGDTYRYGLVMANFEWIGCVPAMLVAAFVFVPHFWRCQVTTIPEYLERRFNSSLRSLVAGVWLLLMACNLGVMLLAAAKFMHTLANWNISVSIIVTAALVGVYTVSGGLRAVVYTDVLQALVMIVGCLVVVGVGLYEVGGIRPLMTRVRETVTVQARQRAQTEVETAKASAVAAKSNHVSLLQPVDSSSPGPWPAILFGLALVVSPGYWITNQCIVQRSLGARSEYEAKASYVAGALLKNLIPFLIAIPGLIALVKFPELSPSDADSALPRLVGAILGEGWRGMFVAAFLAALMSSVDSYLNSAVTIYTNDFYRRYYRPAADDGLMLQVGRWTTIGFVLWAIYFAFQLQSFDAGIYAIFQTMMSFVLGPTFAVILLGVVTANTTGEGALIGFIGGVLTSIGLFLLNQPFVAAWLNTTPLFRVGQAYLYFSIWSFLATVSLAGLFSYFTRPDSPERRRYSIWEWKPSAGETP